jgi:hypothetical protein
VRSLWGRRVWHLVGAGGSMFCGSGGGSSTPIRPGLIQPAQREASLWRFAAGRSCWGRLMRNLGRQPRQRRLPREVPRCLAAQLPLAARLACRCAGSPSVAASSPWQLRVPPPARSPVAAALRPVQGWTRTPTRAGSRSGSQPSPWESGRAPAPAHLAPRDSRWRRSSRDPRVACAMWLLTVRRGCFSISPRVTGWRRQ